MMSDSKVIVVLTTTSSEAEAVQMARALLEEGLAACVQRLPIASTYLWKERIEESAEQLLLVKTLAERASEVEKRIHELSSYEVPEVVALETARVAAGYDAWLRSACGGRRRH
jgi:uncharacterized protein involved in tolerance to divalent cations